VGSSRGSLSEPDPLVSDHSAAVADTAVRGLESRAVQVHAERDEITLCQVLDRFGFVPEQDDRQDDVFGLKTAAIFTNQLGF
jgi:hypothetical protein